MRVNKKYFISLLPFLLTMTLSGQNEKINGNIALQMSSNDSMHLVTALVTNIANRLPVKGVGLNFYIQRTFGLMKVAEGTTDSSGVANAEFPANIQGGDSTRQVLLIAKIEDNNAVNDTASRLVFKSKFVFPSDKPIPRSIAGSNAPWWLSITFTVVVGSIWLLFVYILYLVYRIKKASNKKVIIQQ